MGNFANTVDSGTKKFSSYLPHFGRCGSDITFGKAYPVFTDFVLPGDVFKYSYDMLIRLMPLQTPLLNNINARIRFGFIPLRLVEEDAEFIITGSKNGHNTNHFEDNVPDFKDIFQAWKDAVVANGETVNDNTGFTVVKHSLAEWLFGLVPGSYTYKYVAGKESSPAVYWLKGYLRFWFDYYRDENLDSYSEFEDLYDEVILNLFSFGSHVAVNPLPVYRKKDYFVSSLPWQLKGIAPQIGITGIGFNSVSSLMESNGVASTTDPLRFLHTVPGNGKIQYDSSLSTTQKDNLSANINTFFQSLLNVQNAGFDVESVREGFATTRIMERLARCGSRYTEYLMSNFGTAPSDGTLQRSVYLGGGKMPIIVSEVLQTATDTNASDQKTPVGTMRGHGITRGGNNVQKCYFKEFGMVFAFVDVMPQTIYTQGIPRKFTYKNRWDFVNPSFQHLSEQLIRQGEIFFGNNSNNDKAFGYTGIYNELRKSETRFIGNLRDNLSNWSQAIIYSSAPSLNRDFIRVKSTDYLRPFAVTDESLGLPMVLDINIYNGSYRPLVRESTPGMVDHF